MRIQSVAGIVFIPWTERKEGKCDRILSNTANGRGGRGKGSEGEMLVQSDSLQQSVYSRAVSESHTALWPGSVSWLIRILRNTTNRKRSLASLHSPLLIHFGYKIHGTGAGRDHCSKSLLCRTPNYPKSLTMPPQPSGKAVKKAGKAQKAVRASDKKKKRRRRKESFSIYIYKVSCQKLAWMYQMF